MRKSINGLSVLVQDQLELNPFSSALYVFINRRGDKLKILYWENNCSWSFIVSQNWPTKVYQSKEETEALLMKESSRFPSGSRISSSAV